MTDFSKRHARDERIAALREIQTELDEIDGALWPDNYAGGGAVARLVANVRRLTEILEEKEIA